MGLFNEVQGRERSEPPWIDVVVNLPTRYGLFRLRIAERNNPFRVMQSSRGEPRVARFASHPGLCYVTPLA